MEGATIAECTIGSQHGPLFGMGVHAGPLFGMDVHARSTTVGRFDLAAGEIKAKRFDDRSEPAEPAAWMSERFERMTGGSKQANAIGVALVDAMARWAPIVPSP